LGADGNARRLAALEDYPPAAQPGSVSLIAVLGNRNQNASPH
jgi:hypothetical protein